jgi:hypothetical protein
MDIALDWRIKIDLYIAHQVMDFLQQFVAQRHEPRWMFLDVLFQEIQEGFERSIRHDGS